MRQMLEIHNLAFSHLEREEMKVGRMDMEEGERDKEDGDPTILPLLSSILRPYTLGFVGSTIS